MSPSKQRKGQQRTACDSCRHRKIRCDAIKPTCTWCRHYLVLCTYGGEVLRAPPKRNPELRAARWSSSAQHNQRPLDFTQTIGNLNGIGFISLTLGLPPFSPAARSWIQAKLHELLPAQRPWIEGQFSELHLTCPLWHSPWLAPRLPLSNALDLPDQRVVERCVQHFERSSIRPIFPVLDPALFEGTIELAYQQQETQETQEKTLAARASVLAFLIFAQLLEVGSPLAAVADTTQAIHTVQAWLPLIVHACSADAIQTCVMLLSTQFFTGQLKSAAVTNSIAANLLVSLGGHMERVPFESSGRPDELSIHRHIRTLFWVTYTIDKELSFRLRQPPALTDDYCDLTLSPEYLDALSVDLAPSIPTAGFPPHNFFPSDIRLSQIKSRVFKLLYSAASLEKSAADLVSTIRMLDHDLETWRLSLPPDHRPDLSLPCGASCPAKPLEIRALIVQLEYYHCLTVVHQATSRCGAWAFGPEGIPAGIATSIAVAVEASRSTLRYLKSAEYVLNVSGFRLILFYPVAASIMLFCDILQNPGAPLARQDHDLITQFPCLECDHLLPQLNTTELSHIAHLKSFFRAMGHIALCAMLDAGLSDLEIDWGSIESGEGRQHPV